ncbi:MAG: DUF6599 family protein [Mangrovibacterium sp.]
MKQILFLMLFLLSFTLQAFHFIPPEIPGWTQDGELKVFTGDDLFNHINGASEFYFSYNFQQVWVVRYAKGEAEISLEVYDQGDPVHAYGIYSMERPSGASVRTIGAEGYYQESILNFVTGRYYVKMNAFREQDAGSGILLSTALALAPGLEKKPRLPDVVQAMPDLNRVPNSVQYIPDTFMGLEFLGGAYRATYQTEAGKLSLFVLERKSSEEVKQLLQKYLDFVQADSIALKPEGSCELEDPFNGAIRLNWKGRWIIGFNGDKLPELEIRLSRSVQEKLPD